MITTIRKSMGTRLVSNDDGETLGILSGLIIHPDTGKIEAIVIRPVTLSIKEGIVLTEAILQWGTSIKIKSDREIAESNEIIRINEIVERGARFMNNSVKNEGGEWLGKVADVEFNTKTGYLKSLYVEKKFIVFRLSSRIFSFDSIIQVFPDYILVKDVQTKKETEENKIIKERGLVMDI